MPDRAAQARPHPRKSPRQPRAVETAGVIVEAAARILEARGLDGFSTNAVAERAGVSIGSLYQYFGCKDAVIGALIAREAARLIADAQAAMTEATGAAALSALIHAAVAHQLRRPALARVLDFEEARLPFDPDTRWVADRFRGILRAALLRPDPPPQADGERAAQDVMAIIKGMVDAAGVVGETDRRGLSERVRRAVFGYLSAE